MANSLSIVRRRSRYSLYCLYRQRRDQACKQDTGKSDYDGEKPGQSLLWCQVSVADGQSSNVGKVDPLPNTPSFNDADDRAHARLE